MKKRILLIDSSILMLPAGRKKKSISLDRLQKVSEGMEFAVLDTTIDELKTIRDKNKGKKGRAADLALQLIKKMEIQVIHTSQKVITEANQAKMQLDFYDKVLLVKAIKNDFTVATADLKLKRKLRDRGVKVIFLRGKKRFSIDK